MSADNFIAVQRRGRKYHVWMGDMSGYIENNCAIPGGWMHETFDILGRANEYAYRMCDNEVVEYGVTKFDDTGILIDIWQRIAALRYYFY